MDTFYSSCPLHWTKITRATVLLRTNTSPMQIRTMEKRNPPVRVSFPGKVYRRDNPDATHSLRVPSESKAWPVRRPTSPFAISTGTIEYFVQQFFGAGVNTLFAH